MVIKETKYYDWTIKTYVEDSPADLDYPHILYLMAKKENGEMALNESHSEMEINALSKRGIDIIEEFKKHIREFEKTVYLKILGYGLGEI